MKRIRVLIVDDSALVRRALTQSLSQHLDIEVVATAVDPYAARDKILSLNPDVITLDIEMPRMDGITFLKLLMKHRPIPVVIMSSLTAAGSSKALEALQSGAVEVLEKPSGSNSTYEHGCRLAEVVRAASKARLRPPSAPQPPPAPVAPRLPPRDRSSRQIILMGASTGGTEALKTVLTSLGPDIPGICIVQHIPAQFSLAFANRLDSLCAFEVREARSGDRITPGLALVAPGGYHVVLKPRGAGYEVQLSEGPRIHYQRPAVDVMFESAVKAGAAPYSLGILLTGMGSDGATGLLSLLQNGAETIAQDEQSCVVFGMPREAIRLGAAQSVLPLTQIASRIERFAARTSAVSM